MLYYRLLEYYYEQENNYKNPRNSPVQFIPDFPVSLNKNQQSFSSSSTSSYWFDHHGSNKRTNLSHPSFTSRKKRLYPNQNTRTASKSDDVVFYLGSRGVRLREEKAINGNCSLLNKGQNEMETLANKHRNSDCIYLPCIKVNSDSLPSFVARKQSEHGKSGEMFDKDAMNISYRLPKMTSETSEGSQPTLNKPISLKKIEISIPPVKMDRESTEEIKLPSIRKVSESEINGSSSDKKVDKDKPNTKKIGNGFTHMQEEIPAENTRTNSRQSQTKKCIIIKMPRIDFQPASPEPGINVPRKSPRKPKLTLSRTITQRRLREKEVRNLFEDVKELTSMAENLSRHLKEKAYLC